MASDHQNKVDVRKCLIEERFEKTLFPFLDDQLLFEWEEDLHG